MLDLLVVSAKRPVAPGFVGVVIPAHNEGGHVATAVRAVRQAVAHDDLAAASTWIVVVDDASTDDTALLARRALGRAGEVLSGEFGGAGAARRAGLDRVLQIARERVVLDLAWLATTDADPRVPPGWIAAHLRWWREGVEAVAGMVEPEWEPDTSPLLRRRYEEFMRALGTGYDHPHVYGANLGFTAEVYLRAGGMSTTRTGEDHAMWAALRAVGARVVSVPDDPVTTSSRQIGRAPSGFAALLASLAVE